MYVILIQDVENLGYKNDIVKVKDGYGRNYLIPNRMAIIANDSNRKQLAENLKQQARKLAQLKADAEALAQKLEAVMLTVPMKANEDGRIFGSVTSLQLAEALQAMDITVDRKLIAVPEAKEIGEYEAVAKLHKEVKAVIKFNVVAAEAE
ncbi:MAG: 50S ribosomal protein L9 [Paludibacteraceae bacterium]|nr:50S ribosomal protein L9 [Paludibacteraceae bacterium]